MDERGLSLVNRYEEQEEKNMKKKRFEIYQREQEKVMALSFQMK